MNIFSETNDAIFPDTPKAIELGFTSDKFVRQSYLYPKGKDIYISFIESVSPGRGHFSQLLKNLKKAGYENIKVPTPSHIMISILQKKNFTKTFEDSDLGPYEVEVWVD